MKNQYVGDINDYRKYGLLRLLTINSNMKIAVCWMLTHNDNKSDGNKIHYLNKPEIWEKYDPQLFALLYYIVMVKKERNVNQIENFGILPNSSFFKEEIKDNTKSDRGCFFAKFDESIQNTDIIFFDPDNGISPEKAKPNRKVYIYNEEIKKYYYMKKSILIYQHFPRVNQDKFINKTACDLKQMIKTNKVLSFKTSDVVFFLIPHKNHLKSFEDKIALIENKWGKEICLF